ncbi:MAG: hypothetical protein CLLPBCKN_007872 [Chroococcidiopsis cubana SAG 39.79]|uniref:Uncharacterized protein n=1 Tax=Chroococcidiopsis cubana SAG 39.79 TaxID=388085 RepID=A0AB37U9P2_9CYAN|nr:hypothetical protein [Chroococcidiopsis cubana SAG 39.79]PSB63634.1 hypothetical protein C7B79_13125 [Chroococcidiopsis cubana CCALA 043]RUT01194.1 hypothetical protein DSM107010_65750 [Chroococcidiopsis cubana SAG 39.79]
MIRVKTLREEFEAGENGGYVYGKIQRQRSFPVYVELGIEQEYIPSSQDNSKTEYRLFQKCNVFVAETDEELDREEYIYSSLNVTVIIYC